MASPYNAGAGLKQVHSCFESSCPVACPDRPLAQPGEIKLVPNSPHKWWRNSIFGDGPRVRFDREQRAQWKARLQLQRRPGRLTIAAANVGRVLCDMLGDDGRLDPSHATIAA